MKQIFAAAATLLLILGAHAQNPGVRLLENSYDHLVVSVVTPEVQVGETSFLGEKYSMIRLGDYPMSAQVGYPALPMEGTLIEMPVCSGAQVRVTDAEYDTIRSFVPSLVMPAQPSRSKSDTSVPELRIHRETYNRDSFFGFDLAQVEYCGIARDRVLGRLVISPVQYNPHTGDIVVCRKATLEVVFENSDEQATRQLRQRYHSNAFNIGAPTLNHYAVKTSDDHPIRMVVVSDESFRSSLADYIAWKRQKGFRVDVVYTSDPEVGRTNTSIAAYLKGLYESATPKDPAPEFLLLVGDVAQIPACDDQHPAQSWWMEEHHPTDLYYATWSDGDDLPDCYYGRFSATNVSELTPQIEKTLMYEQYTFPDPSFLNRGILIAGEDEGDPTDYGYNYADPTMDYIARYYVNGLNGFSSVQYYKNNPSNPHTPNALGVTVSGNQSSTDVRTKINDGAGWINYSAHGEEIKWYKPTLTVSNVNSMTNTKKFGVMIGNCCLTNKFDYNATKPCLGEALLRKDGYCGAVGYIGGSNYTYWSEDVYWAVGVRNSISSNSEFTYMANKKGVYDRMFHLNGEDPSEWVTSLGGIIYAGNTSVQNSNSTLKAYYWEVYHLMGDPSVQPWLGTPSDMRYELFGTFNAQDASFRVETVPFCYAAVTRADTVVCAAFADSQGNVSLTIPDAEAGEYTLVLSCMGYKTVFHPIVVHSADIAQSQAEVVKIYPNPAQDYVNVSAPTLRSVAIFDAAGKVVKEVAAGSDRCGISLANVPQGVYFMKVVTDRDIFVKKFVKR